MAKGRFKALARHPQGGLMKIGLFSSIDEAFAQLEQTLLGGTVEDTKTGKRIKFQSADPKLKDKDGREWV